MQQNLKDNVISPLSISLSSTTTLSLMQSILFQLKDHFTSSALLQTQTNTSFLNELFSILHQLITSYDQLTLSSKSKQAYIKTTNSVINSLKDAITSFIEAHLGKLVTNTISTFLNISSQTAFSYNHGTALPNEDTVNTHDSFLNCEELSNEDIINKIKQKIEKKNSDVGMQYNTIQVNPTRTENSHQGVTVFNTHNMFTPLKESKNTPSKGKPHRHVNVNLHKHKKGNTITKMIHVTSNEERNKAKSKCSSAKKITKKPSHISTNVVNMNLNLSIEKQQQQLNNSFNVCQQRRTYSFPNNNLRSNKLHKQNVHIKEEPVVASTGNNDNTVIQQDKLNASSVVNDNSKVNTTFVCTMVRNGNTIQKYTLNTKANQNVPRASHYANYLLSKYKGVIAAYNEGQGKN